MQTKFRSLIAPLALLLVLIPLLVSFVHSAVTTPTFAQSSELQLVSSDADGVVLHAATPNYSLTELPAADVPGTTMPPLPWNTQLTADGLALTNEPGLPQLPFKSVLVGVPPDAEVQVRVLSADGTLLSQRVGLTPAPRPLPAETADGLPAPSNEGVYEPDPTVYTRDDRYPAAAAQIVEDSWLRDQRVVRVNLYPFIYQPVSQQLFWQPDLRVEVTFVRPQTLQNATGSFAPSPFETVFATTLVNYQQTVDNNWRAAPADAGSSTPSIAQTVDLSTDPRYKIETMHEGLHTITYADLQAAGLNVDVIDPRKLHLSHRGVDVALYGVGEADGSFDPGDRLIFYAGPFEDKSADAPYSTETLYIDSNVYWLQLKTTDGLRVTSRSGAPNGGTVPTAFLTTSRTEIDHYWRTPQFSNPEPWFWAQFRTDGAFVDRDYKHGEEYAPQQTFDVVVTNPASDQAYTARVAGALLAESYSSTVYPDYNVSVRLQNGGTMLLNGAAWDSADQVNDPNYRYFAGRLWRQPPGVTHRSSEFLFDVPVNQTALQNGANRIELAVASNLGFAPLGYLNWLQISYYQQFAAVNDRLVFTLGSGAWNYQIPGFTSSELYVFDVTAKNTPVRLSNTSYTPGGGTLSFGATQSGEQRYAIAAAPGLYSPTITRYQPPSPSLFSTTNAADYIIIAPAAFHAAVQPLADHRAAQGLRVKVVDINDLYNLFYDGFAHPHAVRSFLSYVYTNWQAPALSAALLVGDGHLNLPGSSRYVYQAADQYILPNMEWRDPFQGQVDSSNRLAAIVGDDILPDLLIGRLPANNVTELTTMVNKILAYEDQATQPWHNRMVFVADENDPRAGNFPADIDQLITSHVPNGYDITRIYRENYTTCTGSQCPEMSNDIVSALNTNGGQFVTYAGHGSVDRWARVFDNETITQLNNSAQLPIVISMTCLDGTWAYPGANGATLDALAEVLLRSEGKGSVGSFSSTGLGLATGHDVLMSAFYDATLTNRVRTFGEATMAARLALHSYGLHYDLIDTYTIFGDPLLQFIGNKSISLTPDYTTGAPGSVFIVEVQHLPPSTPIDVALLLPGSTTYTTYGQATTNADGYARLAITIDPNAPVGNYSLQVSIPPSVNLGISSWFTDFAVLSSAPVRNSDLVPTPTPTGTAGPSPTPDPQATATATSQPIGITPLPSPTPGQPSSDLRTYIPFVRSE